MAKARKTRSKRKRRSSSRSTRRHGFSLRRFPFIRLLLVILVLFGAYWVWLDASIRQQFEGKRWALPAKVYARPLELYAGLSLSPENLTAELARLGYRKKASLQRPGDYSRDRQRFHLYTRPFRFWDGQEAAQKTRLDFRAGHIDKLEDLQGHALDLVRLDPFQIASVYPAHREDRELVRLSDVPPLLVEALVAVEDRDFYRHHGLSLRGIGRALLANLRAGAVVQGGSTLTQQLVKNFFLSQQRSLWRKLNEAQMALLLELHYSKDEILQAYLNEVFLGQDGARAIHGFGLASRFYFDRPLKQLSTEQLALLVGMVKGPTLYDPRRHADLARKRRNLVLQQMAAQGLISAAESERLQRRPLGVVPRRRQASNAYPAYLDLVRRQLRRDYRDEDLRSEGLRIFTALDPALQQKAQQKLSLRLLRLEKAHGLTAGTLQAAMLVSRAEDGEVLAVVGDRDAQQAGFNRALDARRPIGSLIKPAVYLTALERGYHLASLLDDSPLEWKGPGGEIWTPSNYDRQFRGQVLLHDALVYSLNVPTARLGLKLGLESIGNTLQRLGVQRPWPNYPSALLGAWELTPVEVLQLYQTFAAQGYHSSLRAIRAVVGPDGSPLQRYPLDVEQVVASGPMFLLNFTLQAVTREGTARALAARFGTDLTLAGKTGTTDDLRDSWFAGYDAEHLAVVWVGRDDNQPMGLTGSSGALPIWSDWLAAKGPRPQWMPEPAGIEWYEIDTESGLLAGPGCQHIRRLPFYRDVHPGNKADCAGSGNFFERWFGKQ